MRRRLQYRRPFGPTPGGLFLGDPANGLPLTVD
jgi:hypothetical protein